MSLNPDLCSGQGSLSACGVHAMGLNFPTCTEGSPVSSLTCDRWQRLNSEAFNRCPRCLVDTDVAVYVGGARCFATIRSVWTGRRGAASLAHACVTRRRETTLVQAGRVIASINTKPLPLTTPTRTHNNNTYTHQGRALGLSVASASRCKKPPYT